MQILLIALLACQPAGAGSAPQEGGYFKGPCTTSGPDMLHYPKDNIDKGIYPEQSITETIFYRNVRQVGRVFPPKCAPVKLTPGCYNKQVIKTSGTKTANFEQLSLEKFIVGEPKPKTCKEQIQELKEFIGQSEERSAKATMAETTAATPDEVDAFIGEGMVVGTDDACHPDKMELTDFCKLCWEKPLCDWLNQGNKVHEQQHQKDALSDSFGTKMLCNRLAHAGQAQALKDAAEVSAKREASGYAAENAYLSKLANDPKTCP